jgi:hypothetical protein
MTLPRARVRSAHLVRAKVHDAWLTNRRPEGMRLALPYVAKLESIGLGKAKRVPCPHLVGVEPRAPNDHVIGLSRGIFVELRQTLRGDDSGEPALAALAHQANNRLRRFRVARAALGAINMRLIKNDQCWPPEVSWQVGE